MGEAHLAFLEEIASRHRRGESADDAMAGLLLVRAVDLFATTGSWPQTMLAMVRAAIEHAHSRQGIWMHLDQVLTAIGGSGERGALSATMDYGYQLETAGSWMLAADVYSSVLYAVPVADSTESAACHLRIAHCYRNLNMLGVARTRLRIARRLYRKRGDRGGVLRASLGLAKVDFERGNFPRAAKRLDRIIRLSRRARDRAMLSRAMHDRSGVAAESGEFERAARLGYLALLVLPTSTDRDRIIGDTAFSIAQLGMHDEARGLMMRLTRSTDAVVRWNVQIGLLLVASLQHDLDGFERLVEAPEIRYLSAARMAHWHMAAGVGYARLGRSTASRMHLDRALAIASEHGLNQTIIEAEEALRSDPIQACRWAASRPERLRRIAAGLKELTEKREPFPAESNTRSTATDRVRQS